MVILKAFFQECGICFHQQNKFPLGYFVCCFKIYMFCNFWHTCKTCIFNEKCTLQRELSLFSFDGKDVLHLFILICLCLGAGFTSNCTVYTEHYLCILLMWASVSICLQDHSAFSYSSLFERWCCYPQDITAKLCCLFFNVNTNVYERFSVSRHLTRRCSSTGGLFPALCFKFWTKWSDWN